MRGIDGAARLLAASLTANLPDRLGLLEAANGPVPPNGLDVTPRLIHWTQVPPLAVGVDLWPFVFVVPQRTIELRYADRRQDASMTWDCRYALKVYVYVRGEGFDEVAAARGRLTLGVRETLFAVPKLAAGVRVELPGATEEFSDVEPSEELGGSIGAAVLSVVVSSSEELAPAVPPLGQVLTGVVDVTASEVLVDPGG